jgi:hypothetical protein
MKRFFILLFLGLIGAIIVACTHEDRLRYRVTYTFDTPSGPRSGNHVLETWRALGGGVVGSKSYGLRGEAAVIDFNVVSEKSADETALNQAISTKPSTVFAILTMGDNGQDVDGLMSLPSLVYRPEHQRDCAAAGNEIGCDIYDVGSLSDPKRTLKPEETPTLIAFTDINNPITVRVIHSLNIDRIAETFGPGFAYRGAVIEIVSSGVWPLNSIRLPFENPVTGTPLTRVVEKALPLLDSYREKLRSQRTTPSNSYTPQFHHFLRSKLWQFLTIYSALFSQWTLTIAVMIQG